MSELPKAILRRKPRFPAVWIVPVFAAAGLIYFLAANTERMGPKIKIQFSDAGDLVAGKTVIKYLGVPVGKVIALDVNVASNTVIATARLRKSMGHLEREGATFTTVKPQVGFGGVQGLTTIFSGAYLALHPGDSDKTATTFVGYPDSQPPLSDQAGLSLSLTSSRANSLNAGDPVLFRGVMVGQVGNSTISADGRQVRVYLKIQPRYESFVRENSVFWKAGGIRAKLGLFNSQVSIDSIEALLHGGVEFATPDNPGARVQTGHSFELKNDPPKDMEKWSPAL
jgi:paraquat-inducible protein B